MYLNKKSVISYILDKQNCLISKDLLLIPKMRNKCICSHTQIYECKLC